MANDDRDILEILHEELDFLEKGGYGRSVRTPWLPKSIFQDSLSCLNYGYPYRAHPCNECQLIDFVSPDYQSETIPCHFIPLNEATGYCLRLVIRRDEVNQLTFVAGMGAVWVAVIKTTERVLEDGFWQPRRADRSAISSLL